MSAARLRSFQRSFAGTAPCRVVEIQAAALVPRRLQAPSRVRARDAAHTLALQTGQSVETLALPSLALRSASAPLALRQHAGDVYPSLRSAVSAWWARTDDATRSEHLRGGSAVGRFVTALQRRGLIARYAHMLADSNGTLHAQVGTLGYLRQVGHAQPGALLLNTHFFIYDPRELDSPLAAIGDPIGMVARGGQIQRPPLLPRATLTLSERGWGVERLAADDLVIDLPDGTTLRPRLTTAVEADAPGDPVPERPLLIYRGAASPSAAHRSPSPAYEICLQGRHVSLIRSGGSIDPPHGALVVSFARSPGRGVLDALEQRPTVRYRIPRLPNLVTALQAGPELVRGGDVVVTAASFRDERFQTLGSPDPTAPIAFPADADRTRAGRVGVGVTRAGTLVIVAVQGTSSMSDRGPDAPEGCTLTELAELLAEAGAVDALNLDGGGSTQVFSGPGAVIGSTDARAVPGAAFDRPVPMSAVVR